MAVIERPGGEALLTLHPQHAFTALDTLKISADELAVVDRQGELTVYRPGDPARLVRGLGRDVADVYFVDLKPTRSLEWGTGGLALAGRTCGAYGTLQLAVTSERKLVSAFRGRPMPVTAEGALEHVWEAFATSLRRAADSVTLESGFDALNAHLKRVAERAVLDCEEALEASGLAIRQVFIEEIVERPAGGGMG